jgi:hypothetical protein
MEAVKIIAPLQGLGDCASYPLIDRDKRQVVQLALDMGIPL